MTGVIQNRLNYHYILETNLCFSNFATEPAKPSDTCFVSNKMLAERKEACEKQFVKYNRKESSCFMYRTTEQELS